MNASIVADGQFLAVSEITTRPLAQQTQVFGQHMEGRYLPGQQINESLISNEPGEVGAHLRFNQSLVVVLKIFVARVMVIDYQGDDFAGTQLGLTGGLTRSG